MRDRAALAKLREDSSRFNVSVGSLLGAFVLLHLIPKSPTSCDPYRLIAALAMLSSGIALCYEMIFTRSSIMEERYHWAYRDAPPAIDKAKRRWLSDLDRVCVQLFGVVGAFLLATELLVLFAWFPALGIFIEAGVYLWWGALIGLLSYPWWGYVACMEMLQRYRVAREEEKLAAFRPREITAPSAGHDAVPAQPVTFGKPGEFKAGERLWTHKDLCKSLIVFGQPGSGKTVCVLNSLLQGIIGSTAGERASGLILDPKGDFLKKVATIAEQAGRRDDLVIFSPGDPAIPVRWNPFDNTDDEFEVADRFGAVMEVLGMKDAQSSFWTDKAKQFVQHALVLLRHTSAEPPSLDAVAQLAASQEAVIALAEKIDGSNEHAMRSLKFFSDEWFKMPAETLGGIQGHITAMTNPFTVDPYRRFCSGTSSIKLAEAIDSGKIIYVYMPIAAKEAMARVIGTFMKLEYYREVLKRPDKARPSFFFCDEFQVFFNAGKGRGDADFFERSRQSNHANVIACQNLQSLFKQVERKEAVLNLLGTCATKVFLRNTDKETNHYAADLFGQALFGFSGGSAGAGALTRKNRANASVSYNEQFDHVVRPERFSQLAIPSQRDEIDYAETIVHDATANAPSADSRRYRWSVNPL